MRTVCAVLLIFALTGLAAEKRPITDDTLYDAVIRRLVNDPDLKTNSIEVLVKDRVVTLRGLVDNEKLRLRAERVTKKVEGVKQVVNELKLRP